MAKASAPVAGQLGFELSQINEGGAKPLETREEEKAPRAILPKVAKAYSPPAMPTVQKGSKGSDLIEYLKASGTNPDKLHDAAVWLVQNPDVTAENFFRYLETAEELGHMPISVGTITKAGKWLWGPTWAPEMGMAHAPAEEVKRSRELVAAAQSDLAKKNAEVVGLNQQLTYLQDKVKELSRENEFLKAGRQSNDFGPGRNVLMGTEANV
jgi:hypothetical protein